MSKETNNTISFDVLGEVNCDDWDCFLRFNFIKNPTTITIASSQPFEHKTNISIEVGGSYEEVNLKETVTKGFLWWKHDVVISTTDNVYTSECKNVDLLTLGERRYVTRFYDECENKQGNKE